MSRQENFDNSFWHDPDVEELSGWATLLYIWSWTNPRCGLSGVYKVSRRAMLESKVPADGLDGVLGELAKAAFAYYEDAVLFVRSRTAKLQPKKAPMAKGVLRDIAKLRPDHPMVVRWWEHYGDASWLQGAIEAQAGEGPGPSGTVPQNPSSKRKNGTVRGGSGTLQNKDKDKNKNKNSFREQQTTTAQAHRLGHSVPLPPATWGMSRREIDEWFAQNPDEATAYQEAVASSEEAA